MKLDHVNLTVHDVVTASTFLKKHFACVDAFDDNNGSITALKAEDGMHILLMKGANAVYPKMFHIGFDLETQANVDSMYLQLKNDGIDAEPPQNEWGSWSFHFQCPGANFVIEVACAAEMQ